MNFSGNYQTNQGRDITADCLTEDYNVLDTFLPNNAWQGGVGARFMAGVGICGILGARGIVGVNVLWRVGLDKRIPDAPPVDGFYFELEGGFGLDLLFFSVEYVWRLLGIGTGVYDTGGVVGPGPRSMAMPFNDASSHEIEMSIRPYNTVASTWVGGNSFVPMSMLDAVSYSVLVNNALERTKPSTATLADGTKLLVYLCNDGTHPINGQRVMASRNTNGTWGQPQQISTAGRAAAFPKIHENGGNSAYITWSEASVSHGNIPADENERVNYAAQVLMSLDIKYREFHSGSGLGELRHITNDPVDGTMFMDINPQIQFDSDGDKIIVYYLRRDIGEVLHGYLHLDTQERMAKLVGLDSTYTAMCFRVFDGTQWSNERFVDVRVPGANDPLIFDFTVNTRKVNGDYVAIYAFTFERDNCLQTVEDRDIYLGAFNITQNQIIDAANVTRSYRGETNPQLIVLDNQLKLTWVTDGNTFNMFNVDDHLRRMIRSGNDVEYFHDNYTTSLDYLFDSDNRRHGGLGNENLQRKPRTRVKRIGRAYNRRG
jgi:hypothetical protein